MLKKIDSFCLAIYDIIVATFFFKNNYAKVWFFKKPIFLADITMEIVLKIHLFDFNNTNIWFIVENFIWKFYTIVETLLIIKQVVEIDKYEFVKDALNKNFKTFIVYIFALEILRLLMPIYFFLFDLVTAL